jgi:cation transport regulator ChaC
LWALQLESGGETVAVVYAITATRNTQTGDYLYNRYSQLAIMHELFSLREHSDQRDHPVWCEN